MKRRFRLICLCCCLTALAIGCGDRTPAPTDRESVVSEKPAVLPANAPEDAPKEGRLPDRFKK